MSRSKQAYLVNKTDFENKLTSCNKRITSNKTKQWWICKKKDVSISTNI